MPHTILVADDDPLTERILQHYLKRAGYKVISAANGREAIKLAKRDRPQLVILDVMMPEVDGWTVLKQLQKSGETKGIPVIFLSGNADLMTKEESLHAGAAFVLVKPINPEQLLEVIHRVLPPTDSNGAALD